MRQVVPDVYLFEGLRASNVYLLRSNDGLTLVDTGMPGDVERIVSQLQEAGFALSDLRRIILTHAHVDHTGGLAELARRSGAQVVAHREEAPLIEQKKPVPAASQSRQLLYRLIVALLRLLPGKVDQLVEEGDQIEALGGLQVIHTPGHTPGSMALYQPERRILLCGDALSNGSPMNDKSGLQLPLRSATFDIAQARQSAAKLAALDVQVLCCGHGEPLVERTGEQMRALLRKEQA